MNPETDDAAQAAVTIEYRQFGKSKKASWLMTPDDRPSLTQLGEDVTIMGGSVDLTLTSDTSLAIWDNDGDTFNIRMSFRDEWY